MGNFFGRTYNSWIIWQKINFLQHGIHQLHSSDFCLKTFTIVIISEGDPYHTHSSQQIIDNQYLENNLSSGRDVKGTLQIPACFCSSKQEQLPGIPHKNSFGCIWHQLWFAITIMLVLSNQWECHMFYNIEHFQQLHLLLWRNYLKSKFPVNSCVNIYIYISVVGMFYFYTRKWNPILINLLSIVPYYQSWRGCLRQSSNIWFRWLSEETPPTLAILQYI